MSCVSRPLGGDVNLAQIAGFSGGLRKWLFYFTHTHKKNPHNLLLLSGYFPAAHID